MTNCKKCGHDAFSYRAVGNHIGQYCELCDTWQKWMPQNNQIDTMPFGKYKGQKIFEITDKQYLTWMSKNIQYNNRLVDIINRRLLELS